jgi:hypothetical protein
MHLIPILCYNSCFGGPNQLLSICLSTKICVRFLFPKHIICLACHIYYYYYLKFLFIILTLLCYVVLSFLCSCVYLFIPFLVFTSLLISILPPVFACNLSLSCFQSLQLILIIIIITFTLCIIIPRMHCTVCTCKCIYILLYFCQTINWIYYYYYFVCILIPNFIFIVMSINIFSHILKLLGAICTITLSISTLNRLLMLLCFYFGQNWTRLSFCCFELCFDCCLQ